MPYYKPDLSPSRDESPSWRGEFVSFNGVKRLQESQPISAPPDTTSSYDDTFAIREAYLRENSAQSFERGVPTNQATSSQNYNPDHVKIIDGEHQTLLSVGEITEADEDDDDTQHLAQHRLQLANPKLNEAQRRNLMKHIESHYKNKKKKLKAVAEAGAMKGLPATQDDKIPQDDPLTLERKRAGGQMSRESKLRSFGVARRAAYGRR